MTCIVAVSNGYNVWMGADSAGVCGYNLTIRKDPKIYRVGDFLFGFVESFRMGQLLGYKFVPPMGLTLNTSLEKYMVTDFIDGIRDVFKFNGYASIENNVEEGGCFLVGIKGRIFTIYSDFQVAEVVAPEALSKDGLSFNAIGSGESVAKGALYTALLCDKHPQEAIIHALEAAEIFSVGVKRPFIIEKLEGW